MSDLITKLNMQLKAKGGKAPKSNLKKRVSNAANVARQQDVQAAGVVLEDARGVQFCRSI